MLYTLGRVPSPQDQRDHKLSLYMPQYDYVITTLPTKVKPAHRYKVLDQGQTSKCVAYSGVLSRTVTEWADWNHTINFDPDTLYARCKELDGIPTEEGTYLRVACKILLDEGAVVTKAPIPHRDLVGTHMKIGAYARLRSLEEIKLAVLKYGSAWIGSVWSDSWFSPVKGILPAPDVAVGGHAYSITGYDDNKHTPFGYGAFYVQNSWGKFWGQSGRAWLPYQFVDLDDDYNWEAWRTIDITDAT